MSRPILKILNFHFKKFFMDKNRSPAWWHFLTEEKRREEYRFRILLKPSSEIEIIYKSKENTIMNIIEYVVNNLAFVPLMIIVIRSQHQYC